MNRLFPILNWLPSYSRKDLAGDLPAGLAVGVMLVPQGMAYALIAGLPVVYGLYAALVPQVIYALMGTSRALAVGPVAMDSLLVASGLAGMAMAGTVLHRAGAASRTHDGPDSICTGRVPMASSRTSCRARSSVALPVLPPSSWLQSDRQPARHLVTQSAQLHHLVGSVWEHLGEAHVPTVAVGMGSAGVLLVLKKVAPRVPGALVVVVAGIAAVAWGVLATRTVGAVPSGLPHFHAPQLRGEDLRELLPVAATLALIAFMEAFSVAKSIAQQTKDHEVDPNQELRALGAANAIGALFGAYPSSGGFSRTAVNHRSGARSGISSLVSAAVVALTLTFLTDLFEYLPKACWERSLPWRGRAGGCGLFPKALAHPP